MFIPRPKQRKAATVSDSWRRLEAWLTANVPEVAATLQAGCSKADLTAFEKDFSLSLPDDVKESFRIHNGQKRFTAAGPLAGEPLDPLEAVRSSLSCWRQLFEQEQQSDHDSGLGDRSTSYPPDAIRCEYATPNWIPLGDWDGNCYGVDLNPGPNGIQGQVINFGRDEEKKYVLAVSWGHFLQDIADELEAGNIVAIPDPGGDGRYFSRPGQEDQALFRFYKEWSEAKIPSTFQKVKPAARKPVLPGKVIKNETAKEAKSLVEKFIEAMHAYEMKWLGIRPIHELGWRLIIESSSGHRAEGDRTAKRRVPVEKLELHKYTKQGIREKKAIQKKFGTPRKRAMADGFVQVYPLAYDPARDRVAEVRQVAPDYLIVYMQPVEGVTTRYHLKASGSEWRIDLKDKTSDHVKFEKRSI